MFFYFGTRIDATNKRIDAVFDRMATGFDRIDADEVSDKLTSHLERHAG